MDKSADPLKNPKPKGSKSLLRAWLSRYVLLLNVCKCKVAEGSTILFTLDSFLAKGKFVGASRKLNESSWKGFRYRSYADQKAK